MQVPQIIGLEKERVDPNTTAVSRFHVVREYMVNLYNKTSLVTLACYYTREAYLADKQPVTHMSLQLNAMPTGDSAQFPTWFALQLLESPTPHDLSGATAVYAEEHTA